MPILLFLLLVSIAQANVMDLNENMPTTLEDASTAELGEIDVQGTLIYESGGDLIGTPDLRFGIIPRVHLEYGADFSAHRADHKLGFQWFINDERSWLPSFAISPNLIYPTGTKTRAIDQSAKFIATKTLIGTGKKPILQVHLNYRWTHNSDQLQDEVKVGKEFIAGFAYAFTPVMALIIDYEGQQEIFGVRTTNNLELGWVWEFKEHLYLATGTAIELIQADVSANLSGQVTF